MRRSCVALGFCVSLLVANVAYAESIVVQRGITIALPSGWTASRDTDATWLLKRRNGANVDATMSISVEQRSDHAEAVRQLAALEAAHDATASYTTIAGWPALERKSLEQIKRPDPEEDDLDAARVVVPDDGRVMAWQVTTAIAAGSQLVLMQTLVHPAGDPALADEALALARTVSVPAGDAAATTRELQQLQSGSLRLPSFKATAYATATAPRKATPSGGAALSVVGGGEIEAAISMTGQRIVTETDCVTSFSTNYGQTFARSGFPTTTPPALAGLKLDGDCSVTWGANGRFYRARLGRTKIVPVYVSTNGGAGFSYLALAVDTRPTPEDPNGTGVDQPHITADRVNKSASGGDFVYVVWQAGSALRARVACSQDSGATWSAPTTATSGNQAFPRVSVSKTGNVFVVSRDGEGIVIDKFGSCPPPPGVLIRKPGFPVRLRIGNVACPVPGLDRCNDGNTLASPTIVGDDTDENRVYVVYATTVARGGQDIYVITSTDGGLTWDADTIVANGNVQAVRFMPWAGIRNGKLYIAWYDRRNGSTAATLDRTSYYWNRATLVNGKPRMGTEVNLSGVDDPQCASGWPCGTRAKSDANRCPTPQMAGYCGNDSSSRRCNFMTPNCPSGKHCVTSGGCPKYGDYNGLAVSGGTLVNLWATVTSPLTAVSSPSVEAWAVVTKLP